MSLSLTDLKTYLRVDWSDEDDYLSSLIDTTKDFIVNATDKYADTEANCFLMAQRILCSHWYENRMAMTDSKYATEIPFALNSLLMQIRATAVDPADTNTNNTDAKEDYTTLGMM